MRGGCCTLNVDASCRDLFSSSPAAVPQRVPGILREVIAEAKLGQLPLYAFGASSGGGFVLRLAQAMPEVQVRLGGEVEGVFGLLL